MKKLLAITKREFRAATANKTFIIMTILGPFLILAMTVLPGFLSSRTTVMSSGRPLAVQIAVPAARTALEAAFQALSVTLEQVSDENAAKDGVVNKKYSGFLSVPATWPDQPASYFSTSSTEALIFNTAESVLAAQATRQRIQEAGIASSDAERILSRPKFQIFRLGADLKEESKTSNDFLGILFTVIGFVMLIYMTVLLYGQLIGRSVVQEKTFKTVEIMLSSVSARQLMAGKILGLGLAGLLQYGAWVTMAGLAIKVLGPALNISLPAAMNLTNLVWLVIFFILAFFLYAAGYAGLGAAAEDEHHLGQLAWPLLLCLMVPMVMISPLVMNPDSPITLVLSFIPMTSPIVMLIRILVSYPAWWELVLSIGLLLVSIPLLSMAAAKIFKVGILMTGKRYSLSEIGRWIRQ